MKKFSEILKNNEDYARLLLESEDYRAFLKCFFNIKKAFNSTYSYAVFARQANPLCQDRWCKKSCVN